jgi:hypothetical protein
MAFIDLLGRNRRMVCEEKGDVLPAGATDSIWPSRREFSLSLRLFLLSWQGVRFVGSRLNWKVVRFLDV